MGGSCRRAQAHPCDEPSLAGAIEAAAAHLIIPAMVGPESHIRALAATLHLDLNGLRIVNVPHSHAAAGKAVALVRAGEGDALMKGSLHTDELMIKVVRRLTPPHCARWHSKGRLLAQCLMGR